MEWFTWKSKGCKCLNGIIRCLTDVWNAPNIKKNLILVEVLVGKGQQIALANLGMKTTKDAL